MAAARAWLDAGVGVASARGQRRREGGQQPAGWDSAVAAALVVEGVGAADDDHDEERDAHDPRVAPRGARRLRALGRVGLGRVEVELGEALRGARSIAPRRLAVRLPLAL